MDGVLSDFERRWKNLFDPPEFNDDNWNKFIDGRNFVTLDYFPFARILLNFVDCLNVPVEILSSSGGYHRFEEIAEQKKTWLINHGIGYKANVVPGKRFKSDYAEPGIILIDDTPSVIEKFQAAGGHGILHTQDIAYTLSEVRNFLKS